MQFEAPSLGWPTSSSLRLVHCGTAPDTAAMLGVTANPFTLEGGAGSEQLWGTGWRECQKQVLSACMLPGTDTASSVSVPRG